MCAQGVIEFVCQMEWKAAHSYRQYCPFCVRDERMLVKGEFWALRTPRKLVEKAERKALLARTRRR